MTMHPSDIHNPQRPIVSIAYDERMWTLVYGSEWDGQVGAVHVKDGATSPMRTMLARTFCAAQGASLRFAFCVDEELPGQSHIFVAGDIPDDLIENLGEYLLARSIDSDEHVERLRAPLVFMPGKPDGREMASDEEWQRAVTELREERAREHAPPVAPPSAPADAVPQQDAPTPAPSAEEAAVAPADAAMGTPPEFEPAPTKPEPFRAQLSHFEQFETKAQLDAWAASQLGLNLDARKKREDMIRDVITSDAFVLIDSTGEPVKLGE